MDNVTSNGTRVVSEHYVKKTKMKSQGNGYCVIIFGRCETMDYYGSDSPYNFSFPQES